MIADTEDGRPDRRMARVVEEAILLVSSHGREMAVAYMARECVPLPVIARVIGEPERRRPPPYA